METQRTHPRWASPDRPRRVADCSDIRPVQVRAASIELLLLVPRHQEKRPATPGVTNRALSPRHQGRHPHRPGSAATSSSPGRRAPVAGPPSPVKTCLSAGRRRGRHGRRAATWRPSVDSQLEPAKPPANAISLPCAFTSSPAAQVRAKGRVLANTSRWWQPSSIGSRPHRGSPTHKDCHGDSRDAAATIG